MTAGMFREVRVEEGVAPPAEHQHQHVHDAADAPPAAGEPEHDHSQHVHE